MSALSVLAVGISTGMSSSGNTASLRCNLCPVAERTISTAELVKQLDDELSSITGADIVSQ